MGFWIMLLALFVFCVYIPYKLLSKLIDKWKN
jgi:hypothetical protein